MKKFLISCLESRIESDSTLYGRYLFGPLPRGQGVTIATALRRSLLAEVSGFAVTAVEIVGVQHEYAIIPGTRESVLDLILNLKKLVFTSTNLNRKKALGYITARGPAIITGRDLRLPPGIQCTNPDQVLATLATDGQLNLKITVSAGKNYLVQTGVNVDRPKMEFLDNSRDPLKSSTISPRNVFPIDAVFMPVLRVNYAIQSDEDVLHFPLQVQSRDVTERVIFEIWTNGTLTPREGLHKAAVELIRIFSLFQINTRPAQLLPRVKRPPSFNPPVLETNEMSGNSVTLQTLQLVYEPNQFLAIDIGILPLNSKQLIRLKEKNIHRVGDLLNISYAEMLDLPEMTEDSLFTLLCHLRTYGLQLRSAFQRV